MAQMNDDELYDEFSDMYDLLSEKLIGNRDVAEEFYDGDELKANKEILNILDYLLDMVEYATGNEDPNGDDSKDGDEEDDKKKEDE
jgi:hypothetical protein